VKAKRTGHTVCLSVCLPVHVTAFLISEINWAVVAYTLYLWCLAGVATIQNPHVTEAAHASCLQKWHADSLHTHETGCERRYTRFSKERTHNQLKRIHLRWMNRNQKSSNKAKIFHFIGAGPLSKFPPKECLPNVFLLPPLICSVSGSSSCCHPLSVALAEALLAAAPYL
jgi:hypothetical protein